MLNDPKIAGQVSYEKIRLVTSPKFFFKSHEIFKFPLYGQNFVNVCETTAFCECVWNQS